MSLGLHRRAMGSVRLPAAFKRVNYVMNDATNGIVYIDTGVPAMENNTFFADAQLVDVDENSQTLWGGRKSAMSPEMGNQLSFTKSSGCVQFCVGVYALGPAHDRLRHSWKSECVEGVKRLYRDGALCVSLEPEGFTAGPNVYLFATNNSGAAMFGGGSLRLFSFRAWTDGVLVRDFVPCVRASDGAPGLYDLAGNAFYAPQGPGALTAG
jgi:hypothetical protein